jgi:hypothetical protein
MQMSQRHSDNVNMSSEALPNECHCVKLRVHDNDTARLATSLCSSSCLQQRPAGHQRCVRNNRMCAIRRRPCTSPNSTSTTLKHFARLSYMAEAHAAYCPTHSPSMCVRTPFVHHFARLAQKETQPSITQRKYASAPHSPTTTL